MRAFLALIKDSFRESLDSKVFYLLAAGSLLFSIASLSVGFRKRPFDEALLGVFEKTDWRSIHVSLPETSENVIVPEVRSLEEQAGTFTLVLSAPDADAFNARTVSPGDLARFLSDGGSELPASDELMIHRGEKGFRRYLHLRLRQAGFLPLKIEKTGAMRWAVRCEASDPFRIAGAQSLTFLFGLVEVGLGGYSGRNVVLILQSLLANQIAGWAGILVAIVVTAWFLPNLLRKGSIDLLLARPVSRFLLLLARYLGGLSFVFLNAALFIGGTWLGMTLGTGFVQPGYLLTVVTITLLFAIVYSISCLTAVLFRNVVISVLAPVAFWFLCYLVNTGKATVDNPVLNAMVSLPPALKKITTALYYLLPSTTDLGKLNQVFMRLGEGNEGVMLVQQASLENVDFAGSILSSLLFTAVVVGIAGWLFHRKDF